MVEDEVWQLFQSTAFPPWLPNHLRLRRSLHGPPKRPKERKRGVEFVLFRVRGMLLRARRSASIPDIHSDARWWKAGVVRLRVGRQKTTKHGCKPQRTLLNAHLEKAWFVWFPIGVHVLNDDGRFDPVAVHSVTSGCEVKRMIDRKVLFRRKRCMGMEELLRYKVTRENSAHHGAALKRLCC